MASRGPASPAEPPNSTAAQHRAALLAVRAGLPLLLTIAGVVGLVIGHGRTSAAGAGVVLLGIAVMVLMINWLFRLSVESNEEREAEERAREYFDRTGHWPDEQPQ